MCFRCLVTKERRKAGWLSYQTLLISKSMKNPDFENFDSEKWMELCKKYKVNKDNLGYQVQARIEENNLIIHLDGPEKYKATMTKYAINISRGLIIFLNMNNNPTYCHSDDYKEEYDKTRMLITNNMELMLQILLEDSVEAALNFFHSKQNLFVLDYYCSKMTFENGQWITPKKEIFSDGQFIVPETGEVYSTIFSNMLNDVIYAPKKNISNASQVA